MTKRQPQSTLSRALLDRLFLQLDWVHEVWMLRHTLFDGNRRKRTLDRGPHTDFLKTLNSILSEYVLLQIGKLHDPAVSFGRITLSLEYVVEYGGWDLATRRKLERHKKRLDQLNVSIRPARNRIIAHNDLATSLADAPLGGFKAGADRAYFKTLWTFISTAYVGATGEQCASFSTFSRTDALQVIEALVAPTRFPARRRGARGG